MIKGALLICRSSINTCCIVSHSGVVFVTPGPLMASLKNLETVFPSVFYSPIFEKYISRRNPRFILVNLRIRKGDVRKNEEEETCTCRSLLG